MPADPLTVATIAQAAADLSTISTTLLREATRLGGEEEPVPLRVEDLPLADMSQDPEAGRLCIEMRPRLGPVRVYAERWANGTAWIHDYRDTSRVRGAHSATLYPLSAFPYLAARWVAEHGGDHDDD